MTCGLIDDFWLPGTIMTPNYISNSSADVSLWCHCEGSGNQWQDCLRLQRMFTHNSCLRESECTHHTGPFHYWSAVTTDECTQDTFRIHFRCDHSLITTLTCTVTVWSVPARHIFTIYIYHYFHNFTCKFLSPWHTQANRQQSCRLPKNFNLYPLFACK